MKHQILFTLIGLLVSLDANAFDARSRVKVTNVNGQPIQGSQLSVKPGEVITLTADVFNFGDDCSDSNGCAAMRNHEEFNWKASDRDGNVCEPTKQKDCFANSDFQMNDYGVSFYVPANMGQELKITVSHPMIKTSDTVLLVNGPAQVAETPIPPPATTAAVTPPQPAPQPEITAYSYDTVLANHGRWVFIDGTRYWVPYIYQADWVPYQHGYWTWVAGDGWTWVSYDPWGVVTEHYGLWRHHLVYGWVWSPFEHFEYHPALVTWFNTEGHVGWYPYYAPCAAQYHWGHEHGFNDGYWGGYRSVSLSVGTPGFTIGFTVVANNHFMEHNIYEHRETAVSADRVWRTGIARNTFAEHPGGRPGDFSRNWMENRVHGKIVVTRTQPVTVGGNRFTQPVPIHPLPAQYNRIIEVHSMPIKAPVGSIVMPQAKAPRIIPPIQNGKSLASPPFSPQGFQRTPPARTAMPSIPHVDHPYSDRVRMPIIRGERRKPGARG